MQNNINSSNHPPILPVFIQTLTAIALLIAFWFLITLLPFFEELSLPMPFTLGELLSAILFTVIVVLALLFGVKLERSLYRRLTKFKTAGSMIKLLMVIGSVIILYIFYQPLVLPFTGEMDWVYHLFFLFLLIGLSGIFVYSAYKSLGSASVKTASASGDSSFTGSAVCPTCGFASPPGTPNCVTCGEKPGKPELNCPACKESLMADARFCPGCGTQV